MVVCGCRRWDVYLVARTGYACDGSGVNGVNL